MGMHDTHDATVKAQDLHHKMVGACGPKCFKKLFTDALQSHALDEFYPVVVRAELSAALVRAAQAKEQDNSFDLKTYLKQFKLQPAHLVNLTIDSLAGILEKGCEETEKMLRDLGLSVENGRVTR